MRAVLTRRKKGKGKGNRRAVPAGPPPHSQRPLECCKTHWCACHGPSCWDCVTLDLAESRLGLAVLFGFGALAADGDTTRPAPSVLDCLIAAEEALQGIDFATRSGYRMAVAG